jgi:phosphoribosylformylglycinamidine synthase
MNIMGGSVPKTNIKILKNCMNGLLSTIEKECISSCHDVSEGGLGICLSEMSIGGNIGAVLDISNLNSSLRDDFKLFSESNTRWIVEVKRKSESEFTNILKKENTPFVKIGSTCGKYIIINNAENNLIRLEISEIRDIWRSAISNIMG